MNRGGEQNNLNYQSEAYSAPLDEVSRHTEDLVTPWQLVPPIVTGGRIPAIKTAITPPTSTREIPYQAQQPLPANEDTPLFRVSFAGPDQQWYRVSIGARQVNQNVVVSPPASWPQDASLTARVAPYVDQPFAPAPPAQQPAWQEGEDYGRSAWNGVREKWQQGVQPGSTAREQTLLLEERLVRPIGGTSPVQRSAWQEQARSTPVTPPAEAEDTDKDFLLQIVQPGLAGLMDGSVSTLAPIFAVAFATHRPFTVFLVGMASALGAGISMTFSEALSDDGEITGRGNPFLRGGVTGLMTFLSGAGHALPFLISNIQVALIMAYVVVTLELLIIAAIRHKYFKTKWWLSIVQVVGGGLLVFLAALLLGNA